jgi:hypothetical protein
MFDVEKAADAVLSAIDIPLRSLHERLLVLESRPLPVPGPVGPAGADGRDGQDGRDGKDAGPITREVIIEAVRSDPSIVAEAVRLQLEARPVERGKDGRDGENGKDGKDGKDADPITPGQIDDAIRRYFEANPPQPGKDGNDGSDGSNGADGAPGEPGKDGIGLAGAMIDRSGSLIVTTTDGRAHELGTVVGKDGLDGQPGVPGRNGADGLGFDDMTAEYDGERGIILRFARGEQTKEFAFTLPVVLDRGVFKEGASYEAGDAVSWGGSLWIAQKATADKPEAGDGWRLAVKRGRDGKQGEPGRAGAPGEPGRPGKDLTQLGPDGGKW